MVLVEPGTAKTFNICVCRTLAGVQGLEDIITQLEWADERLDRLMLRHARVLITLTAIVSDEWWWPNHCINGGE